MEQIAVVTVVTAIKGSHVTKRRGRVYMGVDLDMMGWTATKVSLNSSEQNQDGYFIFHLIK